MAGYDHTAGMSNNAVAAYNRGSKPLSKITKYDLEFFELTISLAFAKWLAKTGRWTTCEWHHTGGTWYNAAEFYDPEALALAINEGELDLPALQAEYEQERKRPISADEGIRVSGEYDTWSGTGRHKRHAGKVAFTGIKKGNWIHLDAGGKKLTTGNWISWKPIK